jgi:hypothetical protein
VTNEKEQQNVIGQKIGVHIGRAARLVAILLVLPIFLTACGGSGGGSGTAVIIDHASYATASGGAFSDAATDVTSDRDRNVITIGDFQETVDFDPTDAEQIVTSNGSSDMFIIKQSPTGGFHKCQ